MLMQQEDTDEIIRERDTVIMKKKSNINTVLAIIFLCILIFMIAQMFPLLTEVIDDREDETIVVEAVEALGWRGPLALVGLTALSVILPLIPAAAIGVLTGLTYGVFWGLLIFLAGISLGNLFVVFFVRQVDSYLSGKIKRRKKKHGLLSKETLENINKPEVVAFFLFMIPFVSGAGPYLFAETSVKLWKYIIAVVAGSLPTSIIYLFLGYHISQGSYTIAIITASVLVVALTLIIVFRKKILNMILSRDDVTPS